MLKRIGRDKKANLPRWDICMRIGNEKVHRKVVLSKEDAEKLYSELLAEKAARGTGRSKRQVTDIADGEKKGLSLARDMWVRRLQAIGKADRFIKEAIYNTDLLISIKGEKFPVDQIRPADIIAFIDARAKIKYHGNLPTAKTVNNGRGILSIFFTWAVQEARFCETNPCATIKKSKETPPTLAHIALEELPPDHQVGLGQPALRRLVL